MMIRVMYPNGDFDMVRGDVLDILLARNRVKKFMRSSGWIDPERDRVSLRRGSASGWRGAERRASYQNQFG